jgi:hypothetical protein
MKFKGTVARQPFATESKSEHEAVVLLTAKGPLKLRRVGGNPFHDPKLEELVGRQIVCDGEISSGQLIIRDWDVVASK